MSIIVLKCRECGRPLNVYQKEAYCQFCWRWVPTTTEVDLSSLPGFLTDADVELLGCILAHPGVGTEDIPSSLRGSLEKLDRLKLIRFERRVAGWFVGPAD